MKRKIISSCILGFVLLISLFFGACEDYNDPGTIYGPSQEVAVNPSIITIQPADYAVAGVREIIITGSNFSTNLDSTLVYFQSARPTIKSIQPDRIVLYRPKLSTDLYSVPIAIDVVNPGALSVAQVRDYEIEAPIQEFGDYSTIGRSFQVMEFDKNGNLWIACRRHILKTTADGFFITDYLTQTNLGSTFATFTHMKVGPGDSLYFVLGTRRDIYRLNIEMDSTNRTSPVIYATAPGNVEKLDFDQYGNIYTGRSTGLYFVGYPSRTVATTGHYATNFTFTDIRVFNNYVYAASSTSLYRSQILSPGSLGTDELLVDLRTVPNVSTCTIKSFTIRSDGAIYLCLGNHPTYSLFVLESDGSVTPFYYESIIPPQIDQLIWGNNRYLFLNRGIGVSTDSLRGPYRLGMELNGAPYLGRD